MNASHPNLIRSAGGPVLSTLEADGSRRWLRPRLSRGRFLSARRAVAWGLIALFNLLPWLRMQGEPVILLDVAHRRFVLLGKVFLPTDTFLLALLLIGVFVTIFLITALFGRIWCGWMCPQTVYMEFLYRPIERLFTGRKGIGGPPRKPVGVLRRAGMYGAFLLASFVLAHTFLSYFVGTDALYQWVGRSPLDHPVTFLVILAVTGLMMFDFAFFREQLCIIACPYGRFQSALLDSRSLVIRYDPVRGEPRGRKRQKPAARGADLRLPVLADEPVQGDCIDCRMCVHTCPTGIDIREGLQLECIACAQCIDACDQVMTQIGRPKGLIRYTSQAALAGEPGGFWRPRVIVYPLVLLAAVALFLVTLGGKSGAQVLLLRNVGRPYAILPDGPIENSLRLEITNRDRAPRTYELVLKTEGAELLLSETQMTLLPEERAAWPFRLRAPAERFVGSGRLDLTLELIDSQGQRQPVACRMLGPMAVPANTSTAPGLAEQPAHSQGE